MRPEPGRAGSTLEKYRSVKCSIPCCKSRKARQAARATFSTLSTLASGRWRRGESPRVLFSVRSAEVEREGGLAGGAYTAVLNREQGIVVIFEPDLMVPQKVKAQSLSLSLFTYIQAKRNERKKVPRRSMAAWRGVPCNKWMGRYGTTRSRAVTGTI